MNNHHGAGGPVHVLPGLPATVNQHQVIAQMMRRASSSGFDTWWQRVQSVGFCAAPIQLVGTDEFGRQRIVWVRCNNRRASVCPSCSDLYARDTWQLVAAGTTGGRHHIAPSVSAHPQVFTTLTAPSFGAVHASTGNTCRDHQRLGGFRRCSHGKPLWCSTTHTHADPNIGQPLCADCYDYFGHVLFTWHLPELWRRFTIALRRAITRHLKSLGVPARSVRVSFVKVVEMQARVIPHVHALIRLDPPEGPDTDATAVGDQHSHGPATSGGGEPRHNTSPAWQSPITAPELTALIQQAARTVHLDTHDPSPGQADNAVSAQMGAGAVRVVRFGDQIDTQPITPISTAAHHDSASAATNPDEASPDASVAGVSSRRVAGYLAKYVTKSLHEVGIAARRLSAEAIADLDVTDHVRAILSTIARLGEQARQHGNDTLTGVGRWLHTLGYRGHITTKSRCYSTTMGKLRAIRATWTRQQAAKSTETQQYPHEYPHAFTGQDTEPACWEFDRAGHATLGDRTLVVSAALRHIEARRTGLAECRGLRDNAPPGAGDG